MVSSTLGVALAAFLSTCPRAAAQGTWHRQSTLPTGEHINGVSFVTPQIGYIAGEDEMLMRTTDGGATWSQVPGWERFSFYEGRLGDVFFIDEQNGWVGGAFTYQFQRTTDGGATWQDMPYVGAVWQLEFLSPQVGYARTNSGVFKTTDGGASWSIAFQHSSGAVASMDWWDADRGILAFFATFNDWTLYRTTDGGQSWQQVQSGLEYYGVSFVDMNTVIWGTFAGDICRSTDFGSSFTVVTTEPLGIYASAGIDADSVAIMDFDYAFWISDDAGLTWSLAHEGITFRVAESFPKMRFLDAQRGWATGENGLLWETTDGGHTWIQLSQGMGRTPSDILMYPDGRGFVAGNLLFLRTDDFGEHWRSLAPLIGQQGGQLIKNLDTAGTSTVATVDGRASLLISQDRGDAWQRYDLPDPPPGFQRYLEWVDFIDPNVGFIFGFYLECCGVVYSTTDGGATWQGPAIFDHGELQYGQMFDANVGVALLANNSDMMRTNDGWATATTRAIPFSTANSWQRLAFATPTVGWAGGYYGRIARTTDAGDSWTISTPPGAHPDWAITDFHVIDSQEIYAVGTQNDQNTVQNLPVRVWHSTDGGATWQSLGHDVFHSDDPSFTSADAMAVLPGQGIWTAGFRGFVVSNVVPIIPGDLDGDGDVDLVDFASFLDCVTGPGAGGVPQACTAVDFDNDQDVDFADYRLLQLAFTGSL